MKSIKETTYAFIIRIWLEPREIKNAETFWRGMIEPLDGDKRVYFDHLDKMNTYFAKYLEDIGIKVDNLGK